MVEKPYHNSQKVKSLVWLFHMMPVTQSITIEDNILIGYFPVYCSIV